MCCGRQALTWSEDVEGRATEVECERGCSLSAISAAANKWSQARRALEPAAGVNRLPKALQSDGVDMVCVNDNEPKFLPPVPSED